MTLPTSITTVDDCRQLVQWCIREIGLGYHPDSDAADYVRLGHHAEFSGYVSTGEPLFDAETAERLDALHDQAFELIGDEVYEMGVDEFERISPELFGK